MPARCTEERRLIRTVGLVDTAALGTGSAGVPGINIHDLDALECSLVLDEVAQLPEGPTMDDSPLAFPNREPLADSPEVFEGDAPRGVFGPSHQSLADSVVHVGLEASLSTTTGSKQSFGRLGSLS